MRILNRWTELVASLAILTPALMANAQDFELKNTTYRWNSEVVRSLQQNNTAPTNTTKGGARDLSPTSVPKPVDKAAAGSKPKEPPSVRSLSVSKPLLTESTETPSDRPTDTTDKTDKNVISPKVPDSPPDVPLVVPTDPKQVEIERIQTLTLKEALEIANRSSPPIVQAKLSVEQARAGLDRVVAARYPTVDASLGYTFIDSATIRVLNVAGIGQVNDISGSGVSFSSQQTILQPLNGSIGVNYNVYTSGLVDANIRAAENSLRAAEADLNRVNQATRLSVATAYYDVQNADGQVRVREAQVKNSERSFQDVKAQLDTGIGTKLDVLQAQVQLANTKQGLLSAQSSQATSRSELARQLSLPFNLGVTAADEIKPAEDWKLGQAETILLALKNRSELDVQRLQREVARDRAKAALAALGPQVNLFAAFDQADNLSQPGGVALGYRAGFNVSWRLYDAGAANAEARQFDAERALAESRFTQFADQARFDVVSAYNSLKASREQLPVATLALEEARQALDLARLRLNAGVSTQLDVIQNEDAFTQAEVNRLNAIIDFNQALVRLQRAINGL